MKHLRLSPHSPSTPVRGAPLTTWVASCRDHGLADAARRLAQALPDPNLRSVDAGLELLGERLDAVLSAAAALAPETRRWLSVAEGEAELRAQAEHLSARGYARPELAIDSVALALARAPGTPAPRRQLAFELGRLIEDLPRLSHRASLSPGRGFEPLKARRLELRLDIAALDPALLTSLEARRDALLTEPTAVLEALSAAQPAPLRALTRRWLEAERELRLLRFVRANKNDADGHIRWFLSRDAELGVALTRLGLRGHWAFTGTPPAAACRAAQELESLLPDEHSPGHWYRPPAEPGQRPKGCPSARLELGPSAAPAPSSPRPCWSLDFDAGELSLHRQGDPTSATRLDGDASEAELTGFFERLDALSELAPITTTKRFDNASPSLESWLRAWLARPRAAARSIRLVYVPSRLAHPLGGVPEVGLAFLARPLEEAGLSVQRLKIHPDELTARLDELLGTRAVGIGVYIHNRDQVSELTSLLRSAGYRGRIILGGPETRTIEDVMTRFEHWDAIIRGEAEQALPKVLEIFERYDAGDHAAALSLAGELEGVALRLGDHTLCCHTARRNRASELRCPTPYRWRLDGRTTLKMNFTRGCPYLCTFCPNHQGRAFRAGTTDELWRFAVQAVADARPQPAGLERALARCAAELLGIDPAAPAPPTGLALDLAFQSCPARQVVAALDATYAPFLDERMHEQPGRAAALLELDHEGDVEARPFAARSPSPEPSAVRQVLTALKVKLLATRQLRRRDPSLASPSAAIEQRSSGAPWTLQTSEDNTLVNRAVVLEFLERRHRSGLSNDFVFDPGQNSIRDLLDGRGRVDEGFIAALVRDNPFKIAFGTDGTSNPVLRQNRKPGYGPSTIVAVNRSLGRHGVTCVNNYILLSPETTLFEALEAFALLLLLPVNWRDYGPAHNLRVIKEDTTLSNDEALLFAPDDTGFDAPLRCPRLEALLSRWSLTSMVASVDLAPLLRRMIQHDPELTTELPKLLTMWRADLDDEPELVALAALITEASARQPTLAAALLAVEGLIRREAIVDGFTRHSIRELSESLKASKSG